MCHLYVFLVPSMCVRLMSLSCEVLLCIVIAYLSLPHLCCAFLRSHKPLSILLLKHTHTHSLCTISIWPIYSELNIVILSTIPQPSLVHIIEHHIHQIAAVPQFMVLRIPENIKSEAEVTCVSLLSDPA